MLPKRALRFNSKIVPAKTTRWVTVQSNSSYRFHNRAKFWGASQPVFCTLSLPRQSGIKLKRRHNKTMAWLSAEVTTSLGGLPMYWCYSVFRQESGENFALSKFILSLKPYASLMTTYQCFSGSRLYPVTLETCGKRPRILGRGAIDAIALFYRAYQWHSKLIVLCRLLFPLK